MSSYKINGSWFRYTDKKENKAINLKFVTMIKLHDDNSFISFTFANNPEVFVYFKDKETANECYYRLMLELK